MVGTNKTMKKMSMEMMDMKLEILRRGSTVFASEKERAGILVIETVRDCHNGHLYEREYGFVLDCPFDIKTILKKHKSMTREYSKRFVESVVRGFSLGYRIFDNGYIIYVHLDTTDSSDAYINCNDATL